jgi:hypothetical protein
MLQDPPLATDTVGEERPGDADVKRAWVSGWVFGRLEAGEVVMQDRSNKSSQENSASSPSPVSLPAVTGNIADQPATVDRRTGLDRRKLAREQSGYTGPDRRVASSDDVDDETGLHRRRGPGVRRSDDRRSAEEGEMTGNQFEFVMAVETYKKVNKRMYPTWTEILEVLSQLGYRKVLPRNIELTNVPEPRLWTPDADEEQKKAA